MKFKIVETIEQDLGRGSHMERGSHKQIMKKLEQFILKNCQPYLELNKRTRPLYRGIGGEDTVSVEMPYTLIKKVRKNRKPKDTGLKLHKLFDDAFKKQFGWKVRSEGVFTMSNSEVGSYGVNYIIFPIGNFSFVWSPSIADLYEEGLSGDNLSDIIINFDEKLFKEWKNGLAYRLAILEKYPQLLNTFVKNEYKNTDFLAAVASEHEISIRCNKYLAIQVDFISDDLMDKFFEHY